MLRYLSVNFEINKIVKLREFVVQIDFLFDLKKNS